jgi:hypothetical protein
LVKNRKLYSIYLHGCKHSGSPRVHTSHTSHAPRTRSLWVSACHFKVCQTVTSFLGFCRTENQWSRSVAPRTPLPRAIFPMGTSLDFLNEFTESSLSLGNSFIIGALLSSRVVCDRNYLSMRVSKCVLVLFTSM